MSPAILGPFSRQWEIQCCLWPLASVTCRTAYLGVSNMHHGPIGVSMQLTTEQLVEMLRHEADAQVSVYLLVTTFQSSHKMFPSYYEVTTTRKCGTLWWRA